MNKPTRNEISGMMNDGATMYQISRKYNLTIPALFKLSKSYGIIPRSSVLAEYYQISKGDLTSMCVDEKMTQWDIAREVGRSVPYTHWLIMQKYGIKPYNMGQLYRYNNISERNNNIEKDYINGLTQQETADRNKCSETTVSFVLRENNISAIVPNGIITYKEMSLISGDKIQGCINAGMNQHEIAEHFNISEGTVFNICEKFCIPGMNNDFRCFTSNHREWRRKVLERDHHTCLRCGSHENLEVHHVIKWADAPELRFDVSNGATLCHECHRKINGHEYEYVQEFNDLIQSDNKKEE